MTVLGRGVVFQPVHVTQTCTYSSNNIALQNIGITDFPSKNKNKNKTNKQNFLRTYQFPPNPPPPPTPPKKSNKRSHDTSECFGVSLKLSKLHVKKMTKVKIK